MSMPKPLKSREILEVVKYKLLKQEKNIEVLEQVQYKSKVSALPSLKTESFILYKNVEGNTLSIAQTENLEIKQIVNVEEFKDIANALPNYEQKKLLKIMNEIDVQTTKKPKM